ncbi:DUF2723 domain-containing protein [Candidatus Uhrbacteria bacterium]|nr:DUF2723 domain-containing protein [Candidatus Uhrbacteria bacterium]
MPARRRMIFPAILFAAGLATALPLLPTTFSFEDSAEFAAAAATLGVPHPSGYPLYVLAAHLFTLLPFGTVPWRVAFFSAVCAAAALSAFFVLARKLAEAVHGRLAWRQEALIAIVMLALAASELWWSQAIYAKVYALHVLLLALASIALFDWIERRAAGSLCAAAFFFGLASANHLFLTAPLAPFFVAAVLAADRRAFRSVRLVSTALAALAVGLTPYAWLAWRLLAAAPAGSYAFGSAGTSAEVVAYILRTQYADVGIGGWNKFGIAVDMAKQAVFGLGPVLLFAVPGLASLVRTRRPAARIGAAWCLAVALGFLPIVFLRSTAWSAENAYIYRVYALPSSAFFAVLGAVGVVEAGRFLKRSAAAAAMVAALSAWCLVSGGASLPGVRAFSSPFADAYVRSLIADLPPDAVLIVDDYGAVRDTELFGLAFLQTVEKLRPDVTIAQDAGMPVFHIPSLPARYEHFSVPMRRRMLIDAVLADVRFAGRPIFTTFAPESADRRWYSAVSGGVYAFLRDDRNRPIGVSHLPALPPVEVIRANHALRYFAADILYSRAAERLEQAGSRAALHPLLAAIALDPRPMSDDYIDYMEHRRGIEADEGTPAEP